MAVSEEFREQWLECEEEYGKNIEAGDMPVIGYGEVDETISLPAVKFTAPFNPDGTNVFDSYAHVPMKTFKKRIDDLAGEVSEATSDLVEVKHATIEAIENAEAATTAATNDHTRAESDHANSTAATNRANDKAEYAQTQGGYAKQQGDAAALVDASLSGTVLTVKSRTGAVKSVDTKGDKGDKGDGIDYSTMTPAEKQTLTEQVAEEIAQQGGYVLYPVEESTLSPSSTFKKNAIICIDGVIYRAVRDTANLPLKFVVESSKFVVQTIYGRTAFVRAANTVNSDWAVWVDASNDIRFRQLEDRVARLETFH